MNTDVSGPIKFLVVDDEETIQELYSQILSDKYCGSPHPAGTVSSEEQLSIEVNSGGTTGPMPPAYDLTLRSQGEDPVEAVRNDDDEFAMAFIDVRMSPRPRRHLDRPKHPGGLSRNPDCHRYRIQ
jgi:hypothetical protein